MLFKIFNFALFRHVPSAEFKIHAMFIFATGGRYSAKRHVSICINTLIWVGLAAPLLPRWSGASFWRPGILKIVKLIRPESNGLVYTTIARAVVASCSMRAAPELYKMPVNNRPLSIIQTSSRFCICAIYLADDGMYAVSLFSSYRRDRTSSRWAWRQDFDGRNEGLLDWVALRAHVTLVVPFSVQK